VRRGRGELQEKISSGEAEWEKVRGGGAEGEGNSVNFEGF
jgi:hypothetical protein